MIAAFAICGTEPSALVSTSHLSDVFFNKLVSLYFRELINVTICRWIKAPVIY